MMSQVCEIELLMEENTSFTVTHVIPVKKFLKTITICYYCKKQAVSSRGNQLQPLHKIKAKC